MLTGQRDGHTAHTEERTTTVARLLVATAPTRREPSIDQCGEVRCQCRVIDAVSEKRRVWQVREQHVCLGVREYVSHLRPALDRHTVLALINLFVERGIAARERIGLNLRRAREQ